jgi:DNA-directed RNA polymerase subunit alpha
VGALINLGVLYEDGGNYEGAMECYKRVLAIDPAHGRAKLYLKDAESSLRMRIDEEKTQRLRDRDEVLQLPLSNFELSARCRNALDKLNVRTLGDLTRITEDQLLQFKNFGETSLDEIRDLMVRNDLQLAGSRMPARISQRAEDIFLEQDEDEEGEAEEEEGEDERFDVSVDELGLSTRSRKCMDRLGVSTMSELTRLTEEDLLAAPNFGRTSVAEIKTKLAAHGLSLAETPEEEND